LNASLKEPVFLPSKLPNLLVNGSCGIAVGMATNIPPHNLTEICKGIIEFIKKPDIELTRLWNMSKALIFLLAELYHGQCWN